MKYLVMEQIVLDNGQMRFQCKDKMFELPKTIINENSREEWFEYLTEKYKDVMIERKFFIMKATQNGFVNVLGGKNYVVV